MTLAIKAASLLADFHFIHDFRLSPGHRTICQDFIYRFTQTYACTFLIDCSVISYVNTSWIIIYLSAGLKIRQILLFPHSSNTLLILIASAFYIVLSPLQTTLN